MSPELKARLIGLIGSAIDQRIRILFRDDLDPKITVLIRFADTPGADVLVTSDDEAGIRAIVDRRAPEVQPEPQAALMRFYGVNSMAELVQAQAEHVERLQAKVPPLKNEKPGRTRA